jgi:hypothetical protein
MTLVWETPPARSFANQSVDVSAELAELMTRPGEWARVHVGGGSGVSRRAALLRGSGCEVRTTRAQEGKRTLYARYMETEAT